MRTTLGTALRSEAERGQGVAGSNRVVPTRLSEGPATVYVVGPFHAYTTREAPWCMWWSMWRLSGGTPAGISRGPRPRRGRPAGATGPTRGTALFAPVQVNDATCGATFLRPHRHGRVSCCGP